MSLYLLLMAQIGERKGVQEMFEHQGMRWWRKRVPKLRGDGWRSGERGGLDADASLKMVT
jgi:hypothetical protein